MLKPKRRPENAVAGASLLQHPAAPRAAPAKLEPLAPPPLSPATPAPASEQSAAAFYKASKVVVDTNPELCKDFNETGYCGYGATCKFIHDRHNLKPEPKAARNNWNECKRKMQS